MTRTKLLEEEDGLSESSEESVLVLVVVEEEDEDIKTPSWIDFTIASRFLKTFVFFWAKRKKKLERLGK